MEYEKFKKILDLQKEHDKRISDLYHLKVDLLETFDEMQTAISLLWDEILTEEGADWLSWFLYEKGYISDELREDLTAWDENKNEICKDLRGLYDYLKESNYFRV
jgi:hypothetical protein